MYLLHGLKENKMLREEFERLTGFYPSADLCKEIKRIESK